LGLGTGWTRGGLSASYHELAIEIRNGTVLVCGSDSLAMMHLVLSFRRSWDVRTIKE